MISICLLVLTFYLLDASGDQGAVVRQLASLEWYWLAAAVVASLANNAIASWRFLLIIRRIAGVHVPFWLVMKVNAAALFLGYWTPISIAGDGGRIIWLRKGVVSGYARAFTIVLWDRIIALLALLAFMLPFAPAYVRRLSEYFQVDLLPVVVIIVAVVSVAAVSVRWRSHLRLLDRSATRPRGSELLVHMLVGLLYVATFFLVMVFAGAALDLADGWSSFLVAAPLLFLAQNVPITFGGLGAREVSFLIMLGPVVGDANAVAMALIVGAGFLLASLPGGLMLGELAGLRRESV